MRANSRRMIATVQPTDIDLLSRLESLLWPPSPLRISRPYLHMCEMYPIQQVMCILVQVQISRGGESASFSLNDCTIQYLLILSIHVHTFTSLGMRLHIYYSSEYSCVAPLWKILVTRLHWWHIANALMEITESGRQKNGYVLVAAYHINDSVDPFWSSSELLIIQEKKKHPGFEANQLCWYDCWAMV